MPGASSARSHRAASRSSCSGATGTRRSWPFGRTDRDIANGRSPIVEVIRERGAVTVAAFMDLALYHPAFGYYARASQRSGKAGDFITSVDVGPLFGELLASQFAEMFSVLESPIPNH